MSNSIRDALETAYDAEEDKPEATSEPEAAEEEEAAPEEEAPVDAPEPETVPEEEPEAAPEAAKEPEKADAEEAPADQEEGTEVSGKAPAGWRGNAKQEWDKLPPDVQGEVLRRERETNSVLRESAEARQFVGEFEKAVQPFRGFMEAEGSTPMQSFQNLMQTAAGLRVGTQQQKAGIVSEIIRQYGVDLETLDNMLAGETPAGNAEHDQFAQMLDQRLAPVNQFMKTLEEAKSQSQQNTQQSVQSEIDTFASDPKNVYFEDVRENMAILLDTSAQQGREMSLQQAYNVALHMDPKLAAKEYATPPPPQQTPTESLARKKLAAASVPGSRQAPATPSSPEDLRGALAAAWDASAQR